MDSSNYDPSLFDTLSLTPPGQVSGGPFAQPDLTTAGITGTPNPPTQGGYLASSPSLPDTGNILDDILSTVPGIGALKKLLQIMELAVGDVEKDVATGIGAHPLNIVNAVMGYLKDAGAVIEHLKNPNWPNLINLAAGQLFGTYLTDGLGLNTGEFTGEEKSAVNTIDTMLGFATTMQLIAAAIDFGGKGILANRWGESLTSGIKDLAQELGLTWAMGMTINRSFEVAQGAVLEEAINKQKRPNRIQWPQIRLLLKQHVISPEVFHKLMIAQGFPDEQIDYLTRLQDVTLPIGDIAQLWYREIINDDDAKKAIAQLGFSDAEVGQLFTLYMEKSENEASVTYRTIARQLFENNLITEGQYRQYLEAANFPVRLIDQDIAAVRLLHDTGRLLHSLADIKAEYQHGVLNDQSATTALHELNFSSEYIAELLKTWTLPPLRKQHGLSQAKILSYLVSGVIKPEDATAQLAALGLDPATVSFLVAHPVASPHVRQHARTPALVTQAYVDGILSDAELTDSFKSAAVADNDIPWYVSIAQYKKAHRRKTKGDTLPITAGEIREAFKYGLLHETDAITDLVALGYSDSDALLLLEITNKGVIQPGVPPAFATIGDALAFLVDNGFTIENPPDPRVLAAESMVEGAGYTVIPPTIPTGRPVTPPVGPGPHTPPGIGP